MLEQALTALATAAGSAVVTAAGTDGWSYLRQTLARWFGAGDGEREQTALERLDQTAAALGAAPPPQAESVRIRQEAAWQTRFEDALEALAPSERERAAHVLRALLEGSFPPGTGAGALFVAGDVDVRADRGSIAAALVHGGASIATPHQPDPPQG
ncbi:hypothetical protein [Streptomyces qinglanensis]|uniref:hypothetical protein n=1 Tax=Streptomyces qinglanensis TaxID=943816 RepID=UPI00379BA492